MFPFITAALAAYLIALQMILMLTVGTHRFKTQTGIGIGDDLHLERKVRRHGNLTENAAIFLIVIGLVEVLTGGNAIVRALALLFGAARLSHAIGFSSLAGSHDATRPSLFVAFRALGAFGTAASGMGAAIYLILLLLG